MFILPTKTSVPHVVKFQDIRVRINTRISQSFKINIVSIRTMILNRMRLRRIYLNFLPLLCLQQKFQQFVNVLSKGISNLVFRWKHLQALIKNLMFVQRPQMDSKPFVDIQGWDSVSGFDSNLLLKSIIDLSSDITK